MRTNPVIAEKSTELLEYRLMDAILVVDDEPLIRWSLAETLESAGYRVLEAGTACEALQFFEPHNGRIAIVVLDLRLPDSSDLSLLRRIRQIAPGCRVILMTAHGTQEILDEALRTGAIGVLSKPFDMAHLVAMVKGADPG